MEKVRKFIHSLPIAGFCFPGLTVDFSVNNNNNNDNYELIRIDAYNGLRVEQRRKDAVVRETYTSLLSEDHSPMERTYVVKSLPKDIIVNHEYYKEKH